jgi:MoaA/NifB/PqqE/SkfB family radical SAM enzyme
MGDVYPCVQFPLVCGESRRSSSAEIWQDSPQRKELRSIRYRDLPAGSWCSHFSMCPCCPDRAYMEGDIRGPSATDSEKSYARTGIVPSAAPQLVEDNLRCWKAAAATSEP